MRLITRSTLGVSLVVALACAPKKPPSVFPASVGPGIPTSLHGFRLIKTEQIPERDGGGQLYRFSDETPVQLTVFLYAIPSDVQQGDSTNWVLLEGAKFEQVLPIQVERGRYDTYQMAFAQPEPVVSEGDTIPGHVAAAGTRSGQTISMQLQYLYLIRGQFLKVRATLPGDSWQRAPVPRFAHDLARRVYEQ